MPKAKLSAWMPGTMKPWEPGVYRAKPGSNYFGWSYWNGAIFNGVWIKKDTAMLNRNWGPGALVLYWCGLAQDPKGKP